ncbi:MAG: adenylyl-sulfate kinase [Proteobacteria bacterium]|nr:adenylyl-sulfate kinase [Pseudomonadota bacterium]
MRRGFTLWMTGLPCSGKSTLAEAAEQRLRAAGQKVERLDGDIVRTHLSKGLGFSRDDRDENVRRIGFVADLLARNGVAVVVACISPFRAVRDALRASVTGFVEVHVRCPLEVCMARDVKGMYARALRGEMTGFTGVDDPYEEPVSPHLVVDTDTQSIEVCLDQIFDGLARLGYATDAPIEA